MKLHIEIEPLYITEGIEAKLIAAEYEFAPPSHARTASIRKLFGWHPDKTLSGAVRRHLEKTGTAIRRESRDEGL